MKPTETVSSFATTWFIWLDRMSGLACPTFLRMLLPPGDSMATSGFALIAGASKFFAIPARVLWAGASLERRSWP